MRVARQGSGAFRTSDRGISDLLRVEMQDRAAAAQCSWKKYALSHFDQPIPPVPVSLEVLHGAGKFFLRNFRIGAVGDQSGLTLGHFEEFPIANQVRHAQARHAGLLGSEKFAWASDFQVFLGDRESVLGLNHCVEPLFGFGCDLLAGHEDAERASAAATDAPPQLMLLRETKTLGAIDYHQRGI